MGIQLRSLNGPTNTLSPSSLENVIGAGGGLRERGSEVQSRCRLYFECLTSKVTGSSSCISYPSCL